ncbi:MAG: hypothetical protein WD940_01915 [Patescibacteria group bacterium]
MLDLQQLGKEEYVRTIVPIAVLILVILGALAFILPSNPQSETITSFGQPVPNGGIELDWHLVNPPHPGLTCWAAEVSENFGYLGYGYSYIYCEPSS